ncbi:MAG TPA: FAD-dependent monooxygenase, partial [Candidatus Baltobacteraceae bacterium]
VAAHFRAGRAFLLGDAAHVHSPVGGQGMNTGIGDAVNLSWKLAAVLRNGARVELLDSYEPERIAFARRLVATTDRAFAIASSDGRIARFVRFNVVPRVAALIARSAVGRRFFFRTISQTAIDYRDSPLSAGRAGRIRGGDRLPWVPFNDVPDFRDNFAPLRSLAWQVHVYGESATDVATICERRGLLHYVFAWKPAMGKAGLRRDFMYAVRPDGYVGFAGNVASDLERYLEVVTG